MARVGRRAGGTLLYAARLARGGAGGTPVAVRVGGVSKSVAKAPRTGIGRDKNRGISTILLRRPGAIGAFATDLDKPRRHGPRDGLLCLRTWVTVLYQDIGDGSAGPGGDTRGLGLRGEPR